MYLLWQCVRATSEDSADAAWAGQLETYLNTKRSDLLKNILQCWASLFTPRAIFYRFEQGLQEKEISVAVVVQAMIKSDASGVAFSVHPITQDPNQLIIEGSYGLGEAIVSGQVTPDSYVVRKESRRILDKNVYVQPKGLFRSVSGETVWKAIPQKMAIRQVLTDRQILALSKIILSIEDLYGFPCDIEWALQGKKFYIIQSRPITTLQSKGKREEQKEAVYTKDRYVFFWHIDGIPYLSNDQWCRGYADLDLILLQKGRETFCYISREQVEKCHQEGLTMILNEKTTKRYLKKFRSHLRKMERFSKKTTGKNCSVALWKKADALVTTLWSYYKRTEWVYTDLYYQKTVSKSLRSQLEEMKQEGRAFSMNFYLDQEGGYVKLFKAIAKKIGVSEEKLGLASSEEIIHTLKGHFFPKEILSRKKYYGIAYHQGRRREIGGEEAKAILEALTKEVTGKEKEIRGTTAYGGYVKGKASVIPLTYDDLKQMQKFMSKMPEGSILVASTTSPEFTPVFKKGSAIVTNEGGVGSHAAIVSRELKIPCVVGTGNATEIIKDGMEIEVDADHGIIRLL